ncbi:MAG TPA: hypothetical protein VGM93_08565, partial [Acidimicrobiales bacterium]
FLDQRNEFMDYQLAKPISFDHMNLSVLNDGRHSVPQRIRIEADGKVAAVVDLPVIGDQSTPNGSHTFALRFPKVTGKHIRVSIDSPPDSLRPVTTTDYYTDKSIIMPVGIVDLGIPGLHAAQPTGKLDPACRTNLLQVDGKAVGVSVHGTIPDLLAGKAVGFTACDGKPLAVPGGSVTIDATPGAGSVGVRATGLDLDQVTLRSAAGGRADHTAGSIAASGRPGASRPHVTVQHQGRTALDLKVTHAHKGSWVVLGQSWNLGWHATVGGHDLGPPQLVDGYANGWQLPAGKGTVVVHLEWTPQRVVWGAIAASVAAILLALLLIAWPRTDPDTEPDARLALDARPAMPRPFRLGRVLRYSGPRPGAFATVGTVLLALVVGGALIGPLAGVLLAVVAALAMRFVRARPLLTLGSPALLAISAAYIMAKQFADNLPAGFDWPTYFDAVHQVAWGAVALLVLDVVVDRCWLRRWWPTDDSPV